MEIKEIRRRNFVLMVDKLIEENVYKNQKELAADLGLKSGSYISQLKKGERYIDDRRFKGQRI